MRGTIFGGPNNKDYSILGSILEFPLFWDTTIYRGYVVHGGRFGFGLLAMNLAVDSTSVGPIDTDRA